MKIALTGASGFIGSAIVNALEFLTKISKAYGLKSRLMPVPVTLMYFVARLLGKRGMSKRLFGDLQVDSFKARKLLNWQSVITMDQQHKKIAVFDQKEVEWQ